MFDRKGLVAVLLFLSCSSLANPVLKDRQDSAPSTQLSTFKILNHRQDSAKAGLSAATQATHSNAGLEKSNNSEIKKVVAAFAVLAAAYDGTANTAPVNDAKMICDHLDFKSRCKETTAAWTLAETG